MGRWGMSSHHGSPPLFHAVASLLWHYAFGKRKDTLEVNVERRVINIVPFTPTEKEIEPKADQVRRSQSYLKSRLCGIWRR